MPVTPPVNVQFKTTREVSDNVERAIAESECKTRGEFLEAMLEALLNPQIRNVEVSKKEDTDLISSLQADILRMQNELRENQRPEDSERIEELSALLLERDNQILTLKETVGDPKGLQPNQIVMDLSEAQINQVNTIVEKYKARNIDIEPWQALVSLIANGLLIKE